MTLFLHIGMQKTGEDVLATIYGTSGGDLIAAGLNNDRVEATGGHDRVWGGSGNDTVLGGDGHDTVSGGNGADSLLGDNGNDLIQGGLGNDTLNGGGGVDTLLFTGTTAVRVSLDVTTGQATGYGTDVVSNFENVTGGNGASRRTFRQRACSCASEEQRSVLPVSALKEHQRFLEMLHR